MSCCTTGDQHSREEPPALCGLGSDWEVFSVTLVGPFALVDRSSGSFRRSDLLDPEPGAVIGDGAVVVAVQGMTTDIDSDVAAHYLLARYGEGPGGVEFTWQQPWGCDGESPPGPWIDTSVEECGDGFVTGSERCDDENDEAGDGCDECAIGAALCEDGLTSFWTCDDAGAGCLQHLCPDLFDAACAETTTLAIAPLLYGRYQPDQVSPEIWPVDAPTNRCGCDLSSLEATCNEHCRVDAAVCQRFDQTHPEDLTFLGWEGGCAGGDGCAFDGRTSSIYADYDTSRRGLEVVRELAAGTSFTAPVFVAASGAGTTAMFVDASVAVDGFSLPTHPAGFPSLLVFDGDGTTLATWQASELSSLPARSMGLGIDSTGNVYFALFLHGPRTLAGDETDEAPRLVVASLAVDGTLRWSLERPVAVSPSYSVLAMDVGGSSLGVAFLDVPDEQAASDLRVLALGFEGEELWEDVVPGAMPSGLRVSRGALATHLAGDGTLWTAGALQGSSDGFLPAAEPSPAVYLMRHSSTGQRIDARVVDELIVDSATLLDLAASEAGPVYLLYPESTLAALDPSSGDLLWQRRIEPRYGTDASRIVATQTGEVIVMSQREPPGLGARSDLVLGALTTSGALSWFEATRVEGPDVANAELRIMVGDALVVDDSTGEVGVIAHSEVSERDAFRSSLLWAVVTVP